MPFGCEKWDHYFKGFPLFDKHGFRMQNRFGIKTVSGDDSDI